MTSNYKYFVRIFVFGFLLVNLSFAQRMPQHLEFKHADLVQYDQNGDKKITKIIGNVFFRKGQKELRCELVTYYHETEFTIFEKDVQFQDSSRYLSADRVEYYKEPEKEIAKGNVHLIVDENEIFADELSYIVDDKFILAEKNVQFIDKENDVQLFGGKVTFDRENEIGNAYIKPKLIKLDSLGNVDITINALELNYRGKEKEATAKDSVEITQGDAVSYSNFANYFDNDDRIAIEGNPKVYQGNDKLSAEIIELFLTDKKLDKAHLINNSEMLSQLLIEGQKTTDKVTGKEIWIDIKNDSLRYVQVLEQATSFYHVIEDEEVQGVNQVMGDEIELIFEDGKVRYVNIKSKPGLSRGQFSPAGIAVKDLKWTQ